MFRRPVAAGEADYAEPQFLRPKPLTSWFSIEFGIVYLFLCAAVFFYMIQPGSPGKGLVSIEADSSTYYAVAGVLDPKSPVQTDENTEQLVSLNGNLLGPVYLAKLLRRPLNVALFNVLLLVAMVQLAGRIPGLRRATFLVLFLLSAQTLAAIVTLNKEILASFGIVAFMSYYFSTRRPLWILTLALVASLMARWEQMAIILFFLALQNRWSPLRGRHKAGLVFFIGVLTFAYPLALRLRGGQVAAFLVQARFGGTIVRLNTLQGHFGFPLVFPFKVAMNLFDRWLTPSYFLGPFWYASFKFLQGDLIIPLQTLAMLLLFIVFVYKRGLSLQHVIPYFFAIYAIAIAVNPFVQPRYAYPLYVLLCLEMSRSKDAPEPVIVRKPSQLAGRLRAGSVRAARFVEERYLADL